MMVESTVMTLSLACIIGSFMTVVGLSLVLNPKRYLKMAHDFVANDSLMYIGAFMALLIGLIVLKLHREWTQDWTVLITIFGWLALIKGVFLMLAPDSMKRWTKAFLPKKNTTRIMVAGVIYLAIGLYLAYQGFPAF